MMQGLAGWMSLTGEPDGPPTKSGLSLVDLSGGYVSALALLAGLWRARRDGVGCDCDVSLFETALHELMYVGTWVASRGFEPQRLSESAHPSIVPVPELPHRGRLDRRRLPEAEVLGAALRGDRAARPRRRPALRRLRRPRTTTATSSSRAPRGLPHANDGRLARDPDAPPRCRTPGSTTSREALADPQVARPRRPGRDRAPTARHGAPGRHAAPRRRRGEAGQARALPGRAHRARARRPLRLLAASG